MEPYYDENGITLYCGDALKVLPELSIEFQAIITDPPYSSGGAFRSDRATKDTRSKYQMTGTEKQYPEFTGDNRDQRAFGYWCSLWLAECLQRTVPGGVLAVFTDWRQLPTVTDVVQAGGWVWRGIGVWDKTEAARPSKGRFRNQCEYVVWASNGPMADEGPCLPGVWRKAVNGDEKMHTTGKPLAVMRAVCEIAWREQGAVLDPFAGSGTTLLAARDAGLRAVGIEISEEYCAVIVQRLRQKVLFAG